MRVTDPPTAIVMEDEKEGRMATGSGQWRISPTITVEQVSVIVMQSP